MKTSVKLLELAGVIDTMCLDLGVDFEKHYGQSFSEIRREVEALEIIMENSPWALEKVLEAVEKWEQLIDLKKKEPTEQEYTDEEAFQEAYCDWADTVLDKVNQFLTKDTSDQSLKSTTREEEQP